jgi:hypothetical protein
MMCVILEPFRSPMISLIRLLNLSCPDATAHQILNTSLVKKNEADKKVPREFMVLMEG